ncbi:MAG: exosome complex RNA-binding protein Rrp4 [Candidatus Hodarchaeales archaeon]|jgi:exosome complex component RRP4
MTILVTKNQLVIPGEILARGQGVIGLVKIKNNDIGVVPLEGCYIPLEGDIIIGKISRVGMTSWNVDIRGPYVGTLRVSSVLDRDFDSLRESLTRVLNLGDVIQAEITYFDRTRDPVLTMQGRGLRKITRGRLIEVDPVKIPRIIGKKGSMIQLLKNMTNAQILVGQNGRIVVSANNASTESLVITAIRKIETEAHTSGLTDRIREYLEEKKKLM